MALRHVARSVGVPALRQAPVPRAPPSAGPTPLAYHSRRLGHHLGAMIMTSRKLKYHVEKELGRLFWEERKNTQMYGEKELKEILSTIKSLSEPASESVEHA
ncbi:hypothetical protein C2845_PM18G05320 [Panicum miliaceum]|uniref:Uncharacterized protein n=1 Tax=Panicum miliaceum TaxID=4540 RepID=A0A3L6PKF6_PANMI|nr:hypothetical protein C2845_PM18G05320 [Panicum miliaceum]